MRPRRVKLPPCCQPSNILPPERAPHTPGSPRRRCRSPSFTLACASSLATGRSICKTAPEGARRSSERRAPVLARTTRRLLGGLQLRARGDHAVLDKPPDRDHQLARDRHDADAPAAARTPEPAVEPLRQRTVRLPANPAPRE